MHLILTINKSYKHLPAIYQQLNNVLKKLAIKNIPLALTPKASLISNFKTNINIKKNKQKLVKLQKRHQIKRSRYPKGGEIKKGQSRNSNHI
jgi:hypothetical protein